MSCLYGRRDGWTGYMTLVTAGDDFVAIFTQPDSQNVTSALLAPLGRELPRQSKAYKGRLSIKAKLFAHSRSARIIVRKNSFVACLGLFIAAATVSGSADAATITTFDAPGAGTGPQQGTFPQSVSEAGAITGWYVDSRFVRHGFVRNLDGTITTFDAPGVGTGAGQGTLAYSVSSAAIVAGYYQDANSVSHGFLRSSDGTFIIFDVPEAGAGAGQGTFADAINEAGEVTGNYADANFVRHGFVRAPDGTSPASTVLV